MVTYDPKKLPENLPIPRDDGACNHLEGLDIPSISLQATNGNLLNIFEVSQHKAVFYFYPRTGIPGKNPPIGWNEIPGARGCTPQTYGYRDNFEKFRTLGIQIYGVSTQSTEYQKEAAQRLELPFLLLSDEKLKLTRALKLPTFNVDGAILIRRLTLIVEKGKVIKVFYPIFPPDKNAQEVLGFVNT